MNQEMQKDKTGEIVVPGTGMADRIAEMRAKIHTKCVYRVELDIKQIILGGLPKNTELTKDWLTKRSQDKAEEDKETLPEGAPDLEQFAEQVADEVYQPTEEKGWTTFKTDDLGIYIEGRQIKALVREAAKQRTITKERGFRDALAHGVYTHPGRLYMTRNGLLVKEPDGFFEAVAHVMTMQGPRSTIKRHDYVISPNVVFALVNMNGGKDPMPTEEQLLEALVAGEEIGLGASRAVGVGTYRLVDFHKMDHDEYQAFLKSREDWEHRVMEGALAPAPRIEISQENLNLVSRATSAEVTA